MIATEVISPWTVYWITRLDSINSLCALIAAVGFFGYLAYAFFTFLVNCDTPGFKLPRVNRWFSCLFALAIFVGVVTPTTKEACVIYLIPKIANNESVQEIGVDIKTLARDWLGELRPAGKKDEPAKGE